MQELSTLQFLWKFFEPIKHRKIAYIQLSIQSILIWINAIIHVLFLERIVYFLDWSQSSWFYTVLKIYVAYIIAFEVINFSIRKWGWMNTMPYSIADLYNEYLSRYIRLDNNKIELIWTGKMIWILNEWCKIWWVLLTNILEKWFQLIVALLFTIYMIARVEVMYALYFAILLVCFFLFAVWVNNKLFSFRGRRYEYRNIRMKQFVKVLMSKMEILQTWKIDIEMDAIYKNTDNISMVSKDMSTYRTIIKRTSPLWITIILLMCFYIFWEKIIKWDESLWILVWLSWALIVMQKTISDFISFYVQSSKDFIKVDKMWRFFRNTPEMQWYETGDTFQHISWKISIKDLKYSYDTGNPVFQDFNLDIPGNKVTALVWPSWGWKSTLAKLISGYIRQDSWNIIVDDQDIEQVSLKSYYADIWYLTQEPSVFDGTIRENLLYAVDNKKSNEDEIKKTIKLANCEFIYNLPNGLNTEIWERWVKLSGWQKQRLAIAKIFLKNPKIIILDEPTSALDSISEQKITEAMHNLFKGRSVLIIAHRLQTVKNADNIIVIESWEILEQWTHATLVKKKWFYKQMLDLQSGF